MLTLQHRERCNLFFKGDQLFWLSLSSLISKEGKSLGRMIDLVIGGKYGHKRIMNFKESKSNKLESPVNEYYLYNIDKGLIQIFKGMQ